MNLPRVTEVLGHFTDFDKIPPQVLAHAAERGTRVHQICACIASGLPYLADIAPDEAGFVLSFQQWFEHVEAVYEVEYEVVDTVNGYIGHLDLACRMRGDRHGSIVDYKTPLLHSPTWCGQMAAYKNGWNKANPDRPATRAFALQLCRKGGLPKVREYTDSARDFAAFLSALNAHRYFCNGK